MLNHHFRLKVDYICITKTYTGYLAHNTLTQLSESSSIAILTTGLQISIYSMPKKTVSLDMTQPYWTPPPK